MWAASSLSPAATGAWTLPPPGTLEVWAGPLTAGRFAVAMFNRGAAAAPITAAFSAFNASSSSNFAVFDIWANKNAGTFSGSYTATVASEAVAFLVLTPA
jgi:alpha-galactosidase